MCCLIAKFSRAGKRRESANAVPLIENPVPDGDSYLPIRGRGFEPIAVLRFLDPFSAQEFSIRFLHKDRHFNKPERAYLIVSRFFDPIFAHKDNFESHFCTRIDFLILCVFWSIL